MSRLTIASVFTAAVALTFVAGNSADAQNPNQGAAIASGILQGIANGLNGGGYPPNNGGFYPPNNGGFYPPVYNPPVFTPPTVIQQQAPQWHFNPATGTWTQRQNTNVFHPSVHDPLRNTAINGTQQSTTSFQTLANGNKIKTTHQSWIGADGKPHGQYQTTTTSPTNVPGVKQQSSTTGFYMTNPSGNSRPAAKSYTSRPRINR